MDLDERIESVMREPNPIVATEQEEKVRRNLLIGNVVTFCFVYLKLMPSNEFSILGLKFDHLTPSNIYVILLIYVCYELIYYLWLTTNKFMYWRVRLTGINVQTVRGSQAGVSFSNENSPLDHTGSNENSNFYVWLLESKTPFFSRINAWESSWKSIEKFSFDNTELGPDERTKILDSLKTIEQHTKHLTDTVNNIRISASMRRFDSWFKMLIRSQSWRWIIMDCLFPLVSGFVAVGLLLAKMFI